MLLSLTGAPAHARKGDALAAGAALPKLDRRSALVRVVEAVSPAVVNVATVSARAWVPGRGYDPSLSSATPYVQSSRGSGVLVAPGGLVITNAHVVDEALQITVSLKDGRRHSARLVGLVPDHDLALLQLDEPGPFPYLSVDFSEPLYPGETVIAIGSPFGLEHTITTGVLSSSNRRVKLGDLEFSDLIQTDAPINPGNSGGALLTINGDLIGINTWVVEGGAGLGLAIPAARARKVLHELVRHGEVRAVWLGLSVKALEVGEEPVLDLGGRSIRDVLAVDRVLTGSPADRAGLQLGDRIIAMDGRRLRDPVDFFTALSRVAIGDEFTLSFWRTDQPRRVTLTAEAFNVERADALAWRYLGMTVEAGDFASGAGLRVARVRAGSPSERAGLDVGALIAGLRGNENFPGNREAFYRTLMAELEQESIRLNVSKDGKAVEGLVIGL